MPARSEQAGCQILHSTLELFEENLQALHSYGLRLGDIFSPEAALYTSPELITRIYGNRCINPVLIWVETGTKVEQIFLRACAMTRSRRTPTNYSGIHCIAIPVEIEHTDRILTWEKAPCPT